MTPEPPPQPTAWWLSTARHRPEWQSLKAAGLATFSGRPRALFAHPSPGDIVLLYLACPDHAIRAVGVIGGESGAGNQESETDDIELKTQSSKLKTELSVQLAFELPNVLPWRSLSSAPALADAEPVRRRSSGTLFPLAPAEYEALRALAVERNPELEAAFASVEAGDLP